MTDFLTITEVGDYIGRDLSADDGAVLAVSMACDTVRALTEQDFTPTVGETVTLDGTGTDTLLLPQVPVTAAGTVTMDGTLIDTGDYAATANGHLVRTDGTAWSIGRQNIDITYDYGYAGTVPDDVKMVALSIAYRPVTQGGAISETVGQVSRRYATASTDLTAGEKAILRKYRQAR